MSTHTVSSSSRVSPVARGTWPMLCVLLLGQFMCIIDVFIVNVAMPSIGVTFHASGTALQFVVGGYTAAYAMLLITGARLGDLYGRRRMYLTGMSVFTVASLVCAVAPDIGVLVAFRFAQGAGAAVAVPQIFSLIQLWFTGPARARALSAWAAVLSTGAIAGLVAGGVIVNADLFGQSWRPVFWINVPLGLVLVAGVPRFVPGDRPAGSRGLDIAGLTIAVTSVLLIVLPLVLGSQAGWPAWTWCCIAAGLALGGLFVMVERRVADPLVSLAVVRAPGLVLGLCALACTQVCYGGLLFTFTLHLRSGLGESALRAGLTYLPMAVTFGLTGLYWRRLPARSHPVLPVAGTVVCAAGYLWLATAASGGVWPWLALTAVGVGLGLAVSPLLTLSLAGVPGPRAADASGLLTTSVQLAQLTGVAALGSLFLSTAGSVPAVSRWMAVLSAVGVLPALALRNARARPRPARS